MLTKTPVVQIHLSRFCNYSCLHCYSSSGPTERQSLSVKDGLRITAALFSAGYRRISLSGGEPVLAPGFHSMSRGLAAQGYQVAVITNGSRRRPLLDAMEDAAVHHASVSFDGPSALHDQIRAKKGAFDAALSTLQTLARAGHSCGAILSVTTASLPHLPDLVELVCEAGARHVQLHPVAVTGRALRNRRTIGGELRPEALLRVIAITRLFQRIYPEVHFQADALVGEDAGRMTHAEDELISPLVVTEDGSILPFCFDISRDWRLAGPGESLPDTRLGPQLRALLDSVTAEVSRRPAASFYRELVEASRGTVLHHPESPSEALSEEHRLRRPASLLK